MGDTNQERWNPPEPKVPRPPDNREQRKRLQAQLKKLIGKQIDGRRPMKILIIGSPGMGKSCFCNSMITAMLVNEDSLHLEYFTTGTFDSGRQVTLHLDRFRKYDYIREENIKEDICWPTIFDLIGFENGNTDLLQEILLLILNGYIPSNENLPKVKEYGDNHGLEALRQKYSTYDESMRIDRIIFLASAAENEVLPLNLMDCVVAVAKPENEHRGYVTRDIPLFGVLTKIDTVDQEGKAFQDKEKEFKSRLGIEGSTRYGRCSAYCDRIYQPGEQTWSVLPRLDVPILTFLIAVFSPCAATNASEENEAPITSTGSQTEEEVAERRKPLEIPSYLIRMAIRIVALALLIGLCVMYSPIQSKDVTHDCGMIKHVELASEIYKICEASKGNEITFITRTSIYQMLAIVFYILFELSFEPLLSFMNIL